MQCEIDSSPVTQRCMRACAEHLALHSGRAAAVAEKLPGYVHHQVQSAAQTASEDPVQATASTSHATMKPWPPSSLLVTHVILAVVTCGSRISPVRCQRLSYCRLERISWLRRHMQTSIRRPQFAAQLVQRGLLLGIQGGAAGKGGCQWAAVHRHRLGVRWGQPGPRLVSAAQVRAQGLARPHRVHHVVVRLHPRARHALRHRHAAAIRVSLPPGHASGHRSFD